MNNKGLTLVELIVTIGIMVMIGLVIVANMTGLFSKQEDAEYEAFVKQLEESACMYVETSFTTEQRNNCKLSGCTITIDQLVTKGYITDTLKDPKTSDLVINNQEKYKVNIYWENNVKTCKMNE